MAGQALSLLGSLASSSKARSGAKITSWWSDLGNSAAATQSIDEVEAIWRQLEKGGIESPGQSFDFTKAWINHYKIPASEQLYVTGTSGGKVVALLPLKRVRRMGANVLTWFPGSHVGCNAPLVDRKALKEISVHEREQVWHRMQRAMIGADLVCLHSIPQNDEDDLFSELGQGIEVELLYRSVFESWEECQRTQRTRSRKKHDKQQGAKLRAMGDVRFEELKPGDAKVDFALDTLFAQKAIRFKQWGIDDPFADANMRDFYKELFHDGNSLEGKLHVLSLDNEIVAVRYNLAHKNTVFALISSMSEKSELRPGSPGKQNILAAMQAIFEAGYTVCDMGSGFSDEKRHWCNTTIPLRTHYVSLSAKGAMVAKMHRMKYRVRKLIKDNAWMFDAFKSARSATRGK